MTEVIHNELIARLVRHGEGALIHTALPRLDQIIDSAGALMQEGQWVPLLDALRAILEAARALCDSGELSPEHSIAVDREALHGLMVGLLRVAPLQHSIEGTTQPFEERLDEERALLRRCHTAATSIARRLQREPGMAFEDYQALLAKAPDRNTTLRALAQAGKASPTLFDAKGVLEPIEHAIPATLAARGQVELRVRVHRVDDRVSRALVEPIEFLDKTAESILLHHPDNMDLVYDGSSVERDDLMAAQYLDVPLRIRAAAGCAVLPTAKQKSSLTLGEVLELREVMDKLHRTARKFGAQLGRG